jgi:hypothetical protein
MTIRSVEPSLPHTIYIYPLREAPLSGRDQWDARRTTFAPRQPQPSVSFVLDAVGAAAYQFRAASASGIGLFEELLASRGHKSSAAPPRSRVGPTAGSGYDGPIIRSVTAVRCFPIRPCLDLP